MLGNIKFIGALLGRRMLSSKVFLTIVEELIAEETDESLEPVATILTIAGPMFDVKDWTHYSTVNAQFSQLQRIVSKSTIAPRTRCLLKDVLDMRRRGWRDHRVKQVEAPTTLKQVHGKEEAGSSSSRKTSASEGGWSEAPCVRRAVRPVRPRVRQGWRFLLARSEVGSYIR